MLFPALLAVMTPAAAQTGVEREILLREDLAIPGYEIILVEVTIAVGGREGRHSHPGTLVARMLEGELTMEFEGRPTTVLSAGDALSVGPGQIHEGVNTGDVPVRTLATFVVEKDSPLSLSADCVACASRRDGDFFDSNGVQIHFTDRGTGEPVILMHGLNSDYTESWIDSGVVDALANAGYRVLALDARAHGLSGTPHDPAQYGPEMSLDIARLMAHVGIDRAHIVGYSMGGAIVGKLRAMRPELFITLTMGGRGWDRDSGPNSLLLELADSLEQGGGFMPLYRILYPDWTDEAREARSAAQVADTPDIRALAAYFRGFDFGVTEQSLQSNSVPSLAIVGSADPVKASVGELASVMQNLEIIEIPDADHLEAVPHPLFVASLLEFFQKHAEVARN